jgi:hypothetical protein
LIIDKLIAIFVNLRNKLLSNNIGEGIGITYMEEMFVL